MARAKSGVETGSLLKAIDGSNLKWNVFRDEVLQPFGIKLAKANELNSIPPALLTRLQERLVDLGRFDHQRQKWRDQAAIGQGFSSPTVFPPNILPQIWSPTRIQRVLSPKMSRETLPRRLRSANCLFELPTAKPLYASAFASEAFSEAEHHALPSSLSPSGTTVDFATGLITTGRILHCPFLIFERCQSVESDDLEGALNMCAISGAQCIRGLQDIAQRAHKKSHDDFYAFSCILNDNMATINIHTVDKQGRYAMSALYKFDLVVDEHFNTFLAWIEAIEDWACHSLLPSLKDFLIKISYSGDTPPASPMPSLTLSIDTDLGAIPGLMQALRRTYPKIVWKGDEVAETPINSSIANCGTPAEGRRSQSLALNGTSPNFGTLMLRRGRGHSLVSPINTRNSQMPFAPARPSPFSPRYAAFTPAFINDPISESPCRPPLFSPSTPPPDQPWAAKSPMLVLQRRVDLAMTEVQDLRHQVEMLQSELSVKNQQVIDRLSGMEMLLRLQKKADEDKQRALQSEARNREKAKQMEARMRQEEQSKQQTNEDIECDADTEDEAKHTWISLALRHEGWDVLLEQALFTIALFALVVMGLIVCCDVLPLFSQLPFLLTSKSAWVHVNPRWHFEWPRISKVQYLLPSVDIRNYVRTWRSVE